MKTFSAVFTAAALISAPATCVQGQDFVAHLNAFDRAQERFKFAEVVPYVARNATIEITTCDSSVELFDINTLRESYLSIQKHADLLAIERNVTKLEGCGKNNTCIIYSDMKERVVAFSGKYDSTTISKEVANLARENGKIKIQSIQAVMECS